MTKRCDNCIFFEPTVFISETESGYGLWEGYCTLKAEERRNLYYACEFFVEGNPWKKDHKKILEERRKAFKILEEKLQSFGQSNIKNKP